MVALERQQQSEVEATQTRTLADAEAYSTQRKADAEAYQISTLAEAEAERRIILAKAEKEAASEMLDVLGNNPELADQYVQLLIARELQENSKWIIGGSSGDFSQIFELPGSP
jgi:regulator of protease activity HflC (stomatin/prohibitin superfamily)